MNIYKYFLKIVAIFLMLSSQVAYSNNADESEKIDMARALVLKGKYHESEILLRSLISNGNVDASLFLGTLLRKLDRSNEAIEVLEPLAASGNAEIQVQLAMAYASAEPKNLDSAVFWFRKAAESGHKVAKEILNSMSSIHVDKNGNVNKHDMFSYLDGAARSKLSAADDKVFLCYGLPKAELTAVISAGLKFCYDKLLANEEEFFPYSKMNMDEIGVCSNERLFDAIGKSRAEVAACLPNPGHDLKR